MKFEVKIEGKHPEFKPINKTFTIDKVKSDRSAMMRAKTALKPFMSGNTKDWKTKIIYINPLN